MVPSPTKEPAASVHQPQPHGEVTPSPPLTDTTKASIGRNGFERCCPPSDDSSWVVANRGTRRKQFPKWFRVCQPSPQEDTEQDEIHTGRTGETNNNSVIVSMVSPHDLCLGASFTSSSVDILDDSIDPEDEVDLRWECRKCVVFSFVQIFILSGCVAAVFVAKGEFDEPLCPYTRDDEKLKICGPCGSGTLLFPLGGELEKATNYEIRAVLYLCGILWGFFGISIICDQFMGAIDVITSSTYIHWVKGSGGVRHKVIRPVWNGTVANLTLMALGSSAPEILLAVIELLGNGYFSGDLGPSTIVGSAAFNLFIITATCICAIPEERTRKVEGVDVFAVTSFFSILAYIWLLFVLQVHSKDKVDVEEAVITLILFPVMVILAFVVDKGLIRWIWQKVPSSCARSAPVMTTVSSSNSITKSMSLRRSPTMDGIKKMIGRYTLKQDTLRSRTFYRQKFMSMLTGGKHEGGVSNSLNALTIGFTESIYFVNESSGYAMLPVAANRLPRSPVEINYCTFDGDAIAGKRYEHREGTLYFNHGTQAIIEIPILLSDTCEPSEAFEVKLTIPPMSRKSQKSKRTSCAMSGEDLVNRKSRSSGVFSSEMAIFHNSNNFREATVLKTDTAIVSITNDSTLGNMIFRSPEVIVDKDADKVSLVVLRIGGAKGDISVNYETREGTAKEGEDYTRVDGQLHFADGVTSAQFLLPILRSSPVGEDRSFECVLKDADTAGVKFGSSEANEAICIVHLVAQRTCFAVLLRSVSIDRANLYSAMSAWRDQIVGVFYCGGGPREQSQASIFDWLLHGFALFWKVSFAIVPPASLCGGYPCFVVALMMTGLVTACVGDIAMLLGCCLDIPIDIAAITVVALGTSVPDLFASRFAAANEETADNSIGNVTGSNSVNVFLGLGLPWTMGSLYWAFEGPSEEWQKHVHNGKTYKDGWSQYPDGGLLVPAGSLGFSVAVYTTMALLCLLLLMVRRFVYGGELGGPKCAQWRDAGLLLCLWFGFIGASIANSLSTQT